MDYSILAPAKINLSLKVLGKREDGFHEIETLMTRVSLADTIEFYNQDGFSFSCDDPSVPSDDSNLVVKAVRLFESTTGEQVDHRLHLVKRVPHGAGLGGGSSDAASTLKALNELYGTGLSDEKLRELCSLLGSDVPFFLYPGVCSCTGRGELIAPLGISLDAPVLLMKPGFGVATPFAYKTYASSQKIDSFFYESQKWGELECQNDLERPVFEKYLFLGELKSWLLKQPETALAMMSGSGSTVFAIAKSSQDMCLLEEKVHSLYGQSLSVFSEKMI